VIWKKGKKNKNNEEGRNKTQNVNRYINPSRLSFFPEKQKKKKKQDKKKKQ
jgi:hypothetical protein